jgi:hypothetical protein
MNATRTFSLALLVSFTAFGSACAPDGADEYRDAIPNKDQVQIKLSGSTVSNSGSDGTGTSSHALVGERAKLYLITRDISSSVNAAAYYWLKLAEDIVEHPPTTLEDNQAVWGPHTPALSLLTYKFVVKKDGQGDYGYQLLAKVKNQGDEAYLPLVEGEAQHGSSTTGAGNFSLNFDNARQLDPARFEDGVVSFDYEKVSTQWELDVNFDAFVNEDADGPFDAAYHYRENADLSGDFAFSAESDIDENSSQLESWTLTSRWTVGGAGRSDAIIVGGDLGVKEVNATECWNDMFERTYWTITPEMIEPAEGDPNSCAFGEQS